MTLHEKRALARKIHAMPVKPRKAVVAHTSDGDVVTIDEATLEKYAIAFFKANAK